MKNVCYLELGIYSIRPPFLSDVARTYVVSYYFNRVKSKIASKYGLPSQPRLVDIIAAVPQQYKKV